MLELIKYFIRRIKRDGIGIEAAALAYTSILALVPALTIILSIFAMVPSFEPVKESMMRFIQDNFVPVFADAIMGSLQKFVDHAGSMTVTGLLVLFIVSMMLIRAIDKAINRIWRGSQRRKIITFAIYWTLLTVGPLAMGITVWATSSIVALQIFQDMEMATAVRTVLYVLPFFMQAALIFVLYTVLPVARVKSRDALLSAVVVALLFEISKRVFAAFIINFSDYEAIYGALAALPVLMIWIYINWWLVLLGAELTAVLGIARSEHSKEVPSMIHSIVDTMGKDTKKPEQIISDALAYEKEPAPRSAIKVHVSPVRRDNAVEHKKQQTNATYLNTALFQSYKPAISNIRYTAPATA